MTRPHFRFSLRTMLIVVTAFAVAIAWLGVQWQTVRCRAKVFQFLETGHKNFPENSKGFIWWFEITGETEEPPLARRFMGDRQFFGLNTSCRIPPDVLELIRDYFPTSGVVVSTNAAQGPTALRPDQIPEEPKDTADWRDEALDVLSRTLPDAPDGINATDHLVVPQADRR